MFNGVEYVREICHKRGIAISQLERDCGFSNGYLNPKKLKKIPYDRALLIADYLGLSANYIVTGQAEEKAPTPVSESGQHINIVKIAGRDGSYKEKRLTDEQVKALQAIIDQMPEAPKDL